MQRAWITLMVALFGVCLVSAAWAQPVVITGPGGPGDHFFISTAGGPSPMPGMPPMIIPPLMMGLRAAHLSDGQRKQIGKIMQSNAARTAPLVQQLHSLHEQIADKLLAPGTVSATDLTPLETQAAKIDSQIQQQALDASLQIRAILAPDQLARMSSFHKKMAALQAQMKNIMNEASAASPPEPAP
jgi:hypothetical protein